MTAGSPPSQPAPGQAGGAGCTAAACAPAAGGAQAGSKAQPHAEQDKSAVASSAPVEVEVYSDYVCPYCFLAERPLEQALKEFRASRPGAVVRVRWRPFELRPRPTPTLRPEGDYLQQAWAQGVYPAARRAGVPIKLPSISPQPYSELAFQGFQFAEEAGKGSEYNDAVLRAFFQQDRDIGRPEVLRDIAEKVGLDGAAFAAALADGRYATKHRAALEQAYRQGINSVPTFIVHGPGGALRASGALPAAALRRMLEHGAGEAEE